MTHLEKNIEIKIKNIEVKTIIGVFEEEKKNPQKLFIDVKIKTNASNAMKTDKIEDALDYLEITKLIKEKVENSHFHLLERLMEFLLKSLMKISAIEEVELEIHKPEALKKYGAVVSIKAKSSR